MSWFNVWTGLKNKTCRYLLQRYLGQFLEEKLNLEQLKVDLYNGKATVRNVSLKIEALNELFEAQGWALEVVSGHIGLLTVTVPWNALLTNDSSIEVSDCFISLRPVQRQNDGTSMLESMWSSVSSSMQLAEECMKQQDDDTDDVPETNTSTIPGLEKFAETIDNVLNRIKASFTNTVIRIEYPSKENFKGICLYFNINNLTYKNETGCEKLLKQPKMDAEEISERLNSKTTIKDDVNESTYLTPMFAKHSITINGLRISTEEFKLQAASRPQISDLTIPILEIYDQQNIQIKMKQSEDISGPKVILDVEIGSVYAFLTPRQIHLLFKISEAFQEDETEFNTRRSKKSVDNKYHPHYMKNYESGILQKPSNWLYSEDINAVPSYTKNLRCNETMTNFNEYCDSLTTSISSSSTLNTSSKFHRKSTNLESSGEILNFSVSLASFVCLILYEDILVENNINVNDSPLNETSQQEMNRIANTFFSYSRNMADKKTRSLHLASGKNHVYIHVSPIFAEGNQQRNKNVLSSKIKFVATEVDLYEMLDETANQIIAFDRTENSNMECLKRPEIIINIKSDSTSVTSIDITLEKSELEFDVTIYDRLSAILGPSPFSSKSLESKDSKDENIIRSTIINILSNCLSIKLRFPIVDARPIHDPNRVPWWKQNIREDFLLFTFNMLSIKYGRNTLELIANEIDVKYFEKEMGSTVNLLRSFRSEIKEPVYRCDYPKLSMVLCNNLPLKTIPADSIDNNERAEFHSSAEYGLPFSSKHAYRESDTLHNKRETEESETILLPGEIEEINKFCNQTMGNSKIQIQISLPKVDFILRSKQMYEVIYNRLNTDLLMWEPSSPFLKPVRFQVSPSYLQSEANYNPQSESKNKAYISDTEESDSSISNDYSENSKYYSFYNSTSQTINCVPNDQHSDCSIKIHVGTGSLEVTVPVRNKENNIVPKLYGKFLFEVNELDLFTVSSYKKNKDLAYICLQIGGIKMSHCGTSTTCGQNPKPANMQATLYKTPTGLTKSKSLGLKERDTVTLVIEIRKNLEKKIKRIKITTGIQQMTLRYQPVLSSSFWLNQLIDFLDVPDYPIEGYEPYGVITEFQLHLWDCSVDYRPKDIEYRAVLEIGAFSISSNIISSVTGCNLRFVIEECVLSIAPYGQENNDSDNFKETVMDSKQLVTVLDIGLLDISLLLNEKPTTKSPKLDLRCSVHDAHLRTCCDSGRALAQIIAHIACDDDSLQNENEQATPIPLAEKEPKESELKQQERISLMMAEAVQETVTTNSSEVGDSESMYCSGGIEMFYFPDENKVFFNKNEGESDASVEISQIINFEHNPLYTSYSVSEAGDDALPQVRTELGNIQSKEAQHDLSNDEYCMIDEEETYFLSQCGIKNPTFCEDPLRIVDNHFCLPTDKIDPLKPPDDFPMPVLRYTLCEMTFTWHLYGGKDFLKETSVCDDKKTRETPMSQTYKHGVSYSKGSDNIHAGRKPTDLTWKSIGGPHRNHEVLVEIQLSKVCLSHEVYPNESMHASRQVLLIHEIEIRDRLQTSDINKFLYHPNVVNVPHKTPQHMLVVKVLHVRPNPTQNSLQESSIKISLLPMRLHIDQDTLIFLADYFMNNEDNTGESQSLVDEAATSYKSVPSPIMAVDLPEAVQDLQARKAVSKNIDLLMDDENIIESEDKKISSDQNMKDNSSPIYFREVIFSPEVPIRFDYHGRRVELSRGPITGLLMGLGQLQCSEIRLRKIVYRRGLLGVDKLIAYLCKEWLKDIKRNQLQEILKGVGPTYSFVQFFQGVIDLFRLPIEQYQRDGRIIKGLQLGAQSFTARTALAALEITTRIIQLLQFTAETAFDMVSPGPSIKRTRKSGKLRKKKRPQRPKDVREGVVNAYMIMKQGINDSAATLIETAVTEHDQKGYTGAVGAVMRQIPQLVVCPAVLATQATTNILGGVKSSLVPEAKMEAREKWKHESD